MRNSALFSSGCQQEINRLEQEMDIFKRIFIDKNADYYLEKFSRLEKKKLPLSWNWPAFFLGFYWAFYRKLYFLGAVTLIVSTIASMNITIFIIVQAIASIVFGVFGNFFYYLKLEDEIGKLRFMEGIERDLYINKAGGTNIKLPLIIMGVTLIFTTVALLLELISQIISML